MNEFESRQRIEFCHLFPLSEKLISLQLFLSIYCPLWLLLIKFVSPSQKEVVIRTAGTKKASRRWRNGKNVVKSAIGVGIHLKLINSRGNKMTTRELGKLLLAFVSFRVLCKYKSVKNAN